MRAHDTSVDSDRWREDDTAFEVLADRHRHELRVHCYRMLGSLDEAEDLVQETLLRAWRARAGFEGRSSVRAWLYRIATNACLDAVDGRARRALPHDLRPPSPPTEGLPPDDGVAWLQPFPDRLLAPAPGAEGPDDVVVARETIELAFVAALQHLPPQGRAVLILRDVVGWPAAGVAEHLGLSVAAANSALHRARAVLRERLPERRADWAAGDRTAAEDALVRRYMDAMERADVDGVAALLAADVRATMPPWPMWFQGREAVAAALRASWDEASPDYVGRFRAVATRANAQPAVAGYRRRSPDAEYEPFAIGVLRIDGEHIAEVVAFHDTALFAAFGLPPTLPAGH